MIPSKAISGDGARILIPQTDPERSLELNGYAPAVQLLDQHIGTASRIDLGPVSVREHIRSSMGPFRALDAYRIRYPGTVVAALAELYEEYNAAFAPLVARNREWETDYRSCFGSNGSPVNYAIQIDMVGIPQGFLDFTHLMTVEAVREALRRRVFEFENSLAMYQLLERVFASNGRDSFFSGRFRRVLDDIRRLHQRPVALLAVTQQKYDAMRESEFGKSAGEPLSDDEVYEMSGFDRFFGPKEFLAHLAGSGGQCEYLLYARTSDPIAKLKNPMLPVEHPLLGDAGIRRVIKQHAVTLNIDAPDMAFGCRINDTKEYMAAIGMAFEIEALEDLQTESFERYLANYGISGDPTQVQLRAKPRKGTYGCYGHVRGKLTESDFRGELRRNLRKRGGYVVQPELTSPTVINNADGQEYTAIDRVFFGMEQGKPVFLGGFRSLMPLDSVEAKKGRNHGNASTVWGEISS